MAVGGELTDNGLIRTAGTVPQGITALDHETVHDPVEGKAVIKTFTYKLLKILNCHRGSIFIQRHRDRAVVFYIDPDMVHSRSIHCIYCFCSIFCLHLCFHCFFIAVAFLLSLGGRGITAAGQQQNAAEHSS